MFASAIIVFREVLEAALVVSIILAATRGLKGNTLWVSCGIAGGVIGAGILAVLMDSIANAFDGSGQEIVNAIILFSAVILISWHVIWMNSHGREMALHLKQLGHEVSMGWKHKSMLAIAVGLAVVREGAEIVLLLHGLVTSEGISQMLGGASLGLLGGLIVGLLMYVGFINLSLQKVFAVTNMLLLLIASGMAARGAGFLAQAGIAPEFGSNLWDTSTFLSSESMTGQFFAALIGYIDRPSGIQVIFYTATFCIMLGLMAITRRNATAQETVRG